MHEASVTREIHAEKAAVWAALDDFGGIDKYAADLEQSRIIDGPETGMGAVRECNFADGPRVQEKIIEYEPESSYTIEIIDPGDLPLKESYTTMSVEAVDDTRTKVTWTNRFTPRFGPLGWLMVKLMMTSKVKKNLASGLDGLDRYVTEGQSGQQSDRAEAGTD